MAQGIKQQLAYQGLTAKPSVIQHWQKDADAITRLAVRGMLSDAAKSAARRKLLKTILRVAAVSTRSKA
jgi:ribosomal protein L13